MPDRSTEIFSVTLQCGLIGLNGGQELLPASEAVGRPRRLSFIVFPNGRRATVKDDPRLFGPSDDVDVRRQEVWIFKPLSSDRHIKNRLLSTLPRRNGDIQLPLDAASSACDFILTPSFRKCRKVTAHAGIARREDRTSARMDGWASLVRSEQNMPTFQRCSLEEGAHLLKPFPGVREVFIGEIKAVVSGIHCSITRSELIF